MNPYSFHRNVVILGSTGSIGRNAVIELFEHREHFTTIGLVARNNISLLAEQATLLNATTAITTNSKKAAELSALLPADCHGASGDDAVLELVTRPEVDVVLCAILGNSGLRPVMAALYCGKTVALASKEILCMAGDIIMAAVQASHGGLIVPVDSEHSGLFQCLQGRRPEEISRLWITASGGPFKDKSIEDLEHATLEDALRHPTWTMGAKITIDSATMMNKALELIEAHYLFNVPETKLDAVIHPQSKLHALVELVDGTFMAQLSAPDMRMAIRYGMSFPHRLEGNAARLDIHDLNCLEFSPVDTGRFPAVIFGKEAIRQGGTMPTILNAANDIAVGRFQNGEIRFTDIWHIVERTMGEFTAKPQESLELIEMIDASARDFARKI
ncbi:MAG: 1-deoxy-D-xylulose-5-phosphate reductoisomerase [Victivallales bacterium]|nr:1-deoxy-D-xylulose-5-phosphate reductoisomerase [Victivallales bacterium]